MLMTMTTMTLIAAGLGSGLLWLAVLGIAMLAVVLYVPRRFSGPLTDFERRAARRGHRGRSLLLSLVTPLATLGGFVLLFPPLVELHVPSQVVPGSHAPVEGLERTFWSSLAAHESIDGWTCAVLSRVEPYAGDEALAEAILAAAASGFSGECPQRFDDPVGITKIELSLVEVAARAFILSGVAIQAGPRFEDPGPWDVMRGTLKARVLGEVYLDGGDREEYAGPVILHLGRAMLDPRTGKIDVFTVVREDACQLPPVSLLEAADRKLVARYSLQPVKPDDCMPPSGEAWRVVRMIAECTEGCKVPLTGDFVLAAGDSGFIWTQVLVAGDNAEVQVSGDDTFRTAVARLDGLSEFAAEMRARGLGLVHYAGSSGPIALRREGDDILLQREHGAGSEAGAVVAVSTHPVLNQGPFSWSGFADLPVITCGTGAIRLHGLAGVLDPGDDAYDPSGFLATMQTITWAANQLKQERESQCLVAPDPPPPVPGSLAGPVLTAKQIDAVVAAMRRDREALGLVLLAVAIFSVALGLRRSAT